MSADEPPRDEHPYDIHLRRAALPARESTSSSRPARAAAPVEPIIETDRRLFAIFGSRLHGSNHHGRRVRCSCERYAPGRS